MTIMVHMRTQREVKVAELKAGLSRYLRAAQQGAEIVIKDRDTPIARLLPYKKKDEPKRRLETRPPTRPLSDLDNLPLFAPAGVTVEDVDRALQEERRERLDDLI
jgi:prevent-host-death family protein